MSYFRYLSSIFVLIIFASALTMAQAPDFNWALGFGGTLDDYVYGLNIDDSGNIYAVGKFKSAPWDFGNGVQISATGLFDIYLVKFDPTGVPLWAKVGAGTVSNEARAVAVDAAGNVAMTGGYFGVSIFDDDTVTAVNNFDTYIATYNSDGVLQWITTGNGYHQIKGTGLAVDNDGNFIAIGYFGGTTTDTMNFGGMTVTGYGNRDIYIAKIAPDGTALWVTPAGSDQTGEEPWGVDVDEFNNIYVSGFFQSTATFGPFQLTSLGSNDIFVSKLDPNGNFLWVKGMHGPGADKIYALDYNPANSRVYVSGFMEDTLFIEGVEYVTNGADDIVFGVYESDGTFVTGGIMGSTLDDHAWGVAAKADGNYYISGYFSAPFGGLTGFGDDDVLLAEMQGNTAVWMQQAGGTDVESCYGVRLDAAENIFMSGDFKSPNATFNPYFLSTNGGRDLWISKIYDNVVPVELISFNYEFREGMIVLNWETATETNNSGFEIQKSTDNINYAKIGFVDGAGTSANINKYSYADPIPDGRVYYRLKQIDHDGSFRFSDPIEVNSGSVYDYSLEQNYPNPFNPSTKIKFSIPVDSRVKLTVHNILGETVSVLADNSYPTGKYELLFSAGSLTTGVYFYILKVEGTDGSEFIDSKKMILIK